VANTYLEGTYSEVYPNIADEEGMKRLFKQFSFPGGIPSHVAPGDARLDPRGRRARLRAAARLRRRVRQSRSDRRCVVGDGEAETGPLATSWHSNKFLNPARDGAVLPILHLNGYKIANPTVLARIPTRSWTQLLRGYGYAPYFVEGDEPRRDAPADGATLDSIVDEIRSIQQRARRGFAERPRWPMIVLRTPKGWTGPKVVDGCPSKAPGARTRCRSPMRRNKPEHLAHARAVDASYRPEELFDADGGCARARRAGAGGDARMGANPHANGGLLLRDLSCRTFATTPSRCRAGRHGRARPRACWASSCAT
jgi:xylulose-5-phosphate/fructose-6-phosphate phosphoketolase